MYNNFINGNALTINRFSGVAHLGQSPAWKAVVRAGAPWLAGSCGRGVGVVSRARLSSIKGFVRKVKTVPWEGACVVDTESFFMIFFNGLFHRTVCAAEAVAH
jgi:hypothetical protein